MNEWVVANAPKLIVVAALIGAWFFLRSSANPTESRSRLRAQTENGKPVVLEFFSNF